MCRNQTTRRAGTAPQQRRGGHEAIRAWVEARGGHPATVKRTGDQDSPGILRFDFDDGEREAGLERISWDEFFKKLEESKLALLHQDKTKDGKTSRFFKFVRRDEKEG